MAYREGNNGNNLLIGTDEADILVGNGGNDTLEGGKGNDLFNGGSGNDRIAGEEGDDLLVGLYGNDFLNGGSGDDTLTGGPGFDTMVGGLGADQFNFLYASDVDGSDYDVIIGFNFSEEDKIFIGSGVGATSLDDFFYNRNSGALSFKGKTFAQIDPSSFFVLEQDLEISGLS